MFNRTRAAGTTTAVASRSIAENTSALPSKAKATLAAPTEASNGAQRRPALKDLTNVQGASNAQGVRGRKPSKPVPVAQASKPAQAKPASKRPAESDLEADVMEIVGQESTVAAQNRRIELVEQAVESVAQRATKKRKSEPESDPMQVDEDDNQMAFEEAPEADGDAIEVDQETEAQTAPASGPAEDIDLYDWDDPQAVTEYVDDIYVYMREVEQKYMVNPRYMANQVDINEKMRSILLDWLVEVHRMFKLLPETLFLAVNLIDRFLEVKAVARDKLQLVGVTAMLIASKYEEIYAPECNDFVYISDGAYSKEMILNMESMILSALQFNLNAPSPLHFLRRYSKAAASDYTIHTLCKYLIELTVMDIKLLKYAPSSLAAGAVYIARKMTGKAPLWTPTLAHYTTLSEAEVREVALEMNALLKKSARSTLKAIKKKYALPKYGEVANMTVVDL